MILRHSILLGDVATLVGVVQDQGVLKQYVLKVVWTYAQVSAKPLWWHNTLALMKVNLIHKVDHNNMVRNMLSGGRSSKQWAPSKFLWLMFVSKDNLWWKIREGYINYPKSQKLVGELRKGKALKEIKLVDGLLKYKQSRMYMLQHKLRLLAFKEKYHSPIAGYREEKQFTLEWCQGGTISYI